MIAGSTGEEQHGSYVVLCLPYVLKKEESLLQRLTEDQLRDAVYLAFELDSLHGDFVQILNELDWAEEDYPDVIDMQRFKWLSIYHINNFYLGVYSYIEKLYRFINIVLRLDASEKPVMSGKCGATQIGF